MNENDLEFFFFALSFSEKHVRLWDRVTLLFFFAWIRLRRELLNSAPSIWSTQFFFCLERFFSQYFADVLLVMQPNLSIYPCLPLHVVPVKYNSNGNYKCGPFFSFHLIRKPFLIRSHWNCAARLLNPQTHQSWRLSELLFTHSCWARSLSHCGEINPKNCGQSLLSGPCHFRYNSDAFGFGLCLFAEVFFSLSLSLFPFVHISRALSVEKYFYLRLFYTFIPIWSMRALSNT